MVSTPKYHFFHKNTCVDFHHFTSLFSSACGGPSPPKEGDLNSLHSTQKRTQFFACRTNRIENI